jgi:hypothetical protein
VVTEHWIGCQQAIEKHGSEVRCPRCIDSFTSCDASGCRGNELPANLRASRIQRDCSREACTYFSRPRNRSARISAVDVVGSPVRCWD